VGDDERAFEEWFAEKGFDLYWDERPDSLWVAIAIPHGSRVGAAALASGATRVEAAGRLKEQLQEAAAVVEDEAAMTGEASQSIDESVAEDVTVVAVPAEATADAVPPEVKTVSTAFEMPWESLQGVSASATLPYEILEAADLTIELPADLREQLEARAVEFGWVIGFAKEPDGSFMWVVFDQNGLALQAGVAADWDDSRLETIAALYPPSDEAQSGAGDPA
jgi:hypothetical protein